MGAAKSMNFDETIECCKEFIELCLQMRNTGTPGPEITLALSTCLGLMINFGWPGDKTVVYDTVTKKIIQAMNDKVLAEQVRHHIWKPRDGKAGHQ